MTRNPAASAFALLLLAAVQTNNDVQARVAQVQRMRMSLAAVSDDGDGLALQRREASVFFVKSFLAS